MYQTKLIVSGLLAVSLFAACSPSKNVNKDAGSDQVRDLAADEFLIEAKGRWVSNAGYCNNELVPASLLDMTFDADAIKFGATSVRATWQQVEDRSSYVEQIRRFAGQCDTLDEKTMELAFLRLQAGVTDRVIAISDKHLFMMDESNVLTYWRPYNMDELNELKVSQEKYERHGYDATALDDVLVIESAHFKLDD